MVKSSIIVPAQSTGSASRKRSMDQDDEHNDSNNTEKATDDNETEVNRSTILQKLYMELTALTTI